MKKFILMACAMLMISTSFAKKKETVAFLPEERSRNLMMITDESARVCGQIIEKKGKVSGDYALSNMGVNKTAKLRWSTPRCLAISPDGSELAYISLEGKDFSEKSVMNVWTRSTALSTPPQKRTSRNVRCPSWGVDGNLYFSDISSGTYSQLSSVDSHMGSLVRQITNANHDYDPVLSNDGRMLFFERADKTGPSIWCYDTKTGALMVCCAGFNPCPVGDGHDQFVCARNNPAGYTELWLINYNLGQETVILSDIEHSFTNPDVSPDGQWVVCQGNGISTIDKKKNLDIFAVRIDGSKRVQLTTHPDHDLCPVFSKDGSYVYFLSTRTKEANHYNIWRMNFEY